MEGLSLNDREAPCGTSIRTALIDYTLSRAYCGDLDGEEVEYQQLDDQALFTGKGEAAIVSGGACIH